MRRQALTDGSGSWFNRNKAESFEEAEQWDGNNYISQATGSQWTHEALYKTASGRWILHWWSQWQGSLPDWRELDTSEAVVWLIRNDHEVESLTRQIAEFEL